MQQCSKDKELNRARSKPNPVNWPVRTACTQYCSTQTVLLILPFLQTNMQNFSEDSVLPFTRQLWQSTKRATATASSVSVNKGKWTCGVAELWNKADGSLLASTSISSLRLRYQQRLINVSDVTFLFIRLQRTRYTHHLFQFHCYNSILR